MKSCETCRYTTGGIMCISCDDDLSGFKANDELIYKRLNREIKRQETKRRNDVRKEKRQYE